MPTIFVSILIIHDLPLASADNMKKKAMYCVELIINSSIAWKVFGKVLSNFIWLTTFSQIFLKIILYLKIFTVSDHAPSPHDYGLK